jgi:hypothetical protein
MPSGLRFAADDTPEPLHFAFASLRDVFPDADGTRAEVAWSALHGLATLQAGGRLRASHVQARRGPEEAAPRTRSQPMRVSDPRLEQQGVVGGRQAGGGRAARDHCAWPRPHRAEFEPARSRPKRDHRSLDKRPVVCFPA